MCGADTIERAASGRLPDWAVMRPGRRRHAARVAALMDRWAVSLELSEGARIRWRAAAWLHDALRDAEAGELRERLAPEEAGDLADPLLHGPAAAARLANDEAVDDPPLLRAIAHHTFGHPDLDRLGRALYLADFLEPGRSFAPIRRASLRARMPDAFDAVLATVVADRIRHLLLRRIPVHPRTTAFWNAIASDA